MGPKIKNQVHRQPEGLHVAVFATLSADNKCIGDCQ